jgi:hypothetical protein
MLAELEVNDDGLFRPGNELSQSRSTD